ncbi:MAG: hypothetical protein CL693_07400 [Cellvibrionaceae bacterium]|nr:hypothetical protein [Cellvibrionaceae bacterium]|tara:strand:+ start:27881 stop:28252 length:372 start_codon:yes stop_codon:yes gene_type:complete
MTLASPRSIIGVLICLLISPLATAKPVNHVVLVWLKAEISVEQRNTIMQAGLQLQNIPGVISVHTGLPVASDRAIVDDSFSFGITIELPDANAINSYLEHPIHVNYVATHIKHSAEKLLIYDF